MDLVPDKSTDTERFYDGDIFLTYNKQTFTETPHDYNISPPTDYG